MNLICINFLCPLLNDLIFTSDAHIFRDDASGVEASIADVYFLRWGGGVFKQTGVESTLKKTQRQRERQRHRHRETDRYKQIESDR